MDPLIDGLNRLYRYEVDERAAFERSIDENPLESTTHGVYADWLDEQGEPEEAAFRRAMGKWIGDGNMPPVGKAETVALHMNDHPEWASVDKIPTANVFDAHPDDVPVSAGVCNVWNNYRGMESAFRRAFMSSRQ